MEDHRGTSYGIVTTEHMDGPIPYDRHVILTCVQAFKTNLSAFLVKSAPVVQISDGRDKHSIEYGSDQVRYRNIRPSTKKIEMGAFPLHTLIGKSHLIFPYCSKLDGVKFLFRF